MKWINYRHVWREGYGEWQWDVLSYGDPSPIELETIEDLFLDNIRERFAYNDGYRKTEHSVYDDAPEEVIRNKLSCLHGEDKLLAYKLDKLGGSASEVGLQVEGLEGNKLKLVVNIDGREGTCYISKEMYEAIGKLWE